MPIIKIPITTAVVNNRRLYQLLFFKMVSIVPPPSSLYVTAESMPTRKSPRLSRRIGHALLNIPAQTERSACGKRPYGALNRVIIACLSRTSTSFWRVVMRCRSFRWHRCFCTNISGHRRDDTHLIAFEQRGDGIIDDAVARRKPFCHFDKLIHEFAYRDGFKVDVAIFGHYGHLRAVLLKYHSGGWHHEGLPIDWRREVDPSIGTWPERLVLVVDGEDSGRSASAHIESAGDGEELGGPTAMGQLRHRHVRRETWLKKGPERLRHIDKEAQLVDDGHRIEVGFRIRRTEHA